MRRNRRRTRTGNWIPLRTHLFERFTIGLFGDLIYLTCHSYHVAAPDGCRPFGFELRLWQESEVEWGALTEDGTKPIHSRFEEDNLTLAKLHLLEDARNRAVPLEG